MSSGSAKWAIFAPIFVPMFMLLGYHPGFTQLLYRLGDSPTNAVTPMSAYIWMILATAQTKYMKDIKIGTLISNTRSDRKTDEVPDDKEDNPDHFEDHCDRKKVGDQGTDL